MKDEQGISLSRILIDWEADINNADLDSLGEDVKAKIRVELEEIKKHRDNICKIIADTIWQKAVELSVKAMAKDQKWTDFKN